MTRMSPTYGASDSSTFNERDNVTNLIAALSEALPDISWEIIYVDNSSPDGTASFVREMEGSNLNCSVEISKGHLAKS